MADKQDDVKILMVDDSKSDMELITHIFKNMGIFNEILYFHDSEFVVDFLEARDNLQTISNLKLIILDIKMPKVDGFQILQKIRTWPSLSTIPVVILTSSSEEADIIKAYNLGANSYMVKPVDYDQLIDTIECIAKYWLELNRSICPMKKHSIQ